MKVIAEILSYVALVFTIIGVLCKEKDKSMLFISVYNLLILITYFLLGQLAGSIMVMIALARSITYYIYAKKNLKPNIFVFLVFEIVPISIMIAFWNSPVTLFLLFNLAVTTFTAWQNNMTILRLGFIFSGIMLILYDVFVGAYILIISEAVFFISSLISVVRYDVINLVKKRKENNNILVKEKGE